MKKITLLLVLIFISFVSLGQNNDYSGEWSVYGDEFENILTLEKIESKESSYTFSFFGWRKSYDTYSRQVIRFSGEMKEEVFKIEVIDNIAHYDDNSQVFEKGWSLYNEGEEKCNVYFEFSKNKTRVRKKIRHSSVQ